MQAAQQTKLEQAMLIKRQLQKKLKKKEKIDMQ